MLNCHLSDMSTVAKRSQKDYKPKGWLGLIMGTRLWYAFLDADRDDDAAFERRLDTVVREIGDRGKLVLPEAVTPFHEPTPAPAPAPKRDLTPTAAPAPAPAAAAPVTPLRVASTAMVAAPGQSFSPTMMISSPTAAPQQEGGGIGGSLVDLSAFLEKQHVMMFEREAQQQQMLMEREAKIEAKLEAKWEDRLRQEVERAKPQAASEAISAEQLEALQARLQAMHSKAKLLTEEELGNLEDTIADCIEVMPTADVKDHAVDQTLRMVLLSERMQVDGSFARQLRRKFVA